MEDERADRIEKDMKSLYTQVMELRESRSFLEGAAKRNRTLKDETRSNIAMWLSFIALTVTILSVLGVFRG